jgi:hypothetical protein
MASIGPVTLSISDLPLPSTEVQVDITYIITATGHDGEHEQAYREVVELIGVDTVPGEDQVDDVIPGGKVSEGIVRFSSSEVILPRSFEVRLPAATLDEDPDLLLPRADEIRARVVLTPLPPDPASRESNLVTRGLVVQPPTT